jgi:spermidine synthase
MMLKKILSYLIPIRIFKTKSSTSKSIEITWANGELVLDSENTNYSYGSLQRILKIGLKNISYKSITKMQDILVLGVAGGSVVKTLVNEIKFKGQITGVEIDSEVIYIAEKYFHLSQIPNFNIIIDDAFEFILKTKNNYDLIIIDIFQDINMPNFLFEKFFVHHLCLHIKSKGYILFNTMILNPEQEVRNKKYISDFYQDGFKIKTIPRIENHNELIIIHKIA